MLEDVISRGTGKRANIGRPSAGKTGTTSDYKDAWFVGYTPDLVAGVWLGNDDSTSMDGIMGGQTPAATWQSFMSKALANVPAHDFDEVVASYRQSAKQEKPSNNYNPRQSDYDNQSTTRRDEPQPAPTPQPQQEERRDYNDNIETYSPPAQTYNEPTYYEPPAQTYNEPSYSEPPQTYNEPTYNEPPPQTYNEPAPSYDDAPSPGGDLSKGRN